MSKNNTIVESLQKMYDQGQFAPCLDYIRFPAYKKFSPDSRIDFKFPITALVGQNGSSKSSVLRAIYSAPHGKSLSDYWFSTDLDTIPKDHAFVYGYFNQEAKQQVEVAKNRVSKTIEGRFMPDYWEPTTPRKKFGMALFEYREGMKGCSKTRWNTIAKPVEYLDFRHDAISAYDKFFYYGKFNKTKTIFTKQDFIRKRSKLLNKFLQHGGNSFFFHRKNRIISKIILDSPLIKKISYILDKEYSKIIIIRHTFFTDEPADTILLETEDLPTYTEAFAGSGEFAVISLVNKVSQAKEKSLILLDEPEVSIHPRAQEKLVDFLLEEAKQKKHQIVFSTHSPAMLTRLPKEAIHVLYQDAQGKTRVLSNIHRDQAFTKIGWNSNKKTIIVEDTTALDLLQHILDSEDLSKNFDIKVFPGGAEMIKTKLIPLNSTLDEKNFLYYLDGDKKTKHINPNEIAPLDYPHLKQKIKESTGCNISIPCDGHNGEPKEKQKQSLELKFLAYYREHVEYLPCQIPEDIIWETLPEKDKRGFSNKDTKECFSLLTQERLPTNDANTIRFVKQMYIKNIDVKNNKYCQEILKVIKNFLEKSSVLID